MVERTVAGSLPLRQTTGLGHKPCAAWHIARREDAAGACDEQWNRHSGLRIRKSNRGSGVRSRCRPIGGLGSNLFGIRYPNNYLKASGFSDLFLETAYP